MEEFMIKNFPKIFKQFGIRDSQKRLKKIYTREEKTIFSVIAICFAVPLVTGLFLFWYRSYFVTISNWSFAMSSSILLFLLFFIGGVLFGNFYNFFTRQPWTQNLSIREKLFHLVVMCFIIFSAYFLLQPINAYKDFIIGKQYFTGSCTLDTKYYRARGRICYIKFHQNGLERKVEANLSACKKMVKTQNIFSEIGFYDGDCSTDVRMIYLMNNKLALTVETAK